METAVTELLDTAFEVVTVELVVVETVFVVVVFIAAEFAGVVTPTPLTPNAPGEPFTILLFGLVTFCVMTLPGLFKLFVGVTPVFCALTTCPTRKAAAVPANSFRNFIFIIVSISVFDEEKLSQTLCHRKTRRKFVFKRKAGA